MNFLMKKMMKYLPAVALCAVIGTGAAAAVNTAEVQPAADTSVITAGVLSSTVRGAAGSANSSDQMATAEKNIANELAQEAAAKAAAEKAAAAAKAAATAYTPSYGRQVVFSSANTASAAVKANGKALGTFRLSFYCPCAKCCGKSEVMKMFV